MAKPRKQKLKLFRTAAGFHDAYVAAPSRKAALEAWGAETDLFSAGIASQVEDAALLKEASQRPGEVVKRKRGTEKEWKAAARPSPSRGDAAGPSLAQGERGKRKAAVAKAEAAVAALEEAQARERAALAKEQEALNRKRRAMEARHDKAMARAVAKRDAAARN